MHIRMKEDAAKKTDRGLTSVPYEYLMCYRTHLSFHVLYNWCVSFLFLCFFLFLIVTVFCYILPFT